MSDFSPGSRVGNFPRGQGGADRLSRPFASFSHLRIRIKLTPSGWTAVRCRQIVGVSLALLKAAREVRREMRDEQR